MGMNETKSSFLHVISIAKKLYCIYFSFSAEGTPFYVDTAGIVYMLNRNFGNTWIQVANTKKHVSIRAFYGVGFLWKYSVYLRLKTSFPF